MFSFYFLFWFFFSEEDKKFHTKSVIFFVRNECTHIFKWKNKQNKKCKIQGPECTKSGSECTKSGAERECQWECCRSTSSRATLVHLLVDKRFGNFGAEAVKVLTPKKGVLLNGDFGFSYVCGCVRAVETQLFPLAKAGGGKKKNVRQFVLIIINIRCLFVYRYYGWWMKIKKKIFRLQFAEQKKMI